MKNKIYFLLLVLFLIGCKTQTHQHIVHEEFIYEIADAKTPQCHASTIAASGNYLIASWFGGTAEKNDDVGIWLSRKKEGKWSRPKEVANGIENDSLRYPCWNPVLFQTKAGVLMLFYKVGPNPRSWWGMLMTSSNNGDTWSNPIRLPKDIYGPIKNKPIQLANGNILCPTSTEHDGWKVQVEHSTDLGETWTSTGNLAASDSIGAIQPALLQHPNDVLQMLCRTQNGFIAQSCSNDGGKSWSELELTNLPNPNSGIDAQTLKDGRHLLVYNPTGGEWGDRVPLSLAISKDGKEWTDILELESLSKTGTTKDDEYSYPSIIQTKDGLIHIVYTWNRKTVKYVLLDPKEL